MTSYNNSPGIMNVREIIETAFGDFDGNAVNFKLLQTVLFLLARQMRLLERRVEVELGPIPVAPTGSTLSVTEVKIHAMQKKKKKTKDAKEAKDAKDTSGKRSGGTKTSGGKSGGGKERKYDQTTDEKSDKTAYDKTTDTTYDKAFSDIPTADKTFSDKTSTDKTFSDKTSTDKTSTDKTTSSKSTAGKTSSDKTSTDKTTSSKSTSDKTSSDKTSTERTASSKTTTDRTTSSKSTTSDRTTTDKSSSDRTTTDKTSSSKTTSSGDKSTSKSSDQSKGTQAALGRTKGQADDKKRTGAQKSGAGTTGRDGRTKHSSYTNIMETIEERRERELRVIHQRADSLEEGTRSPTPMASMSSTEAQYEKILVVERVPSRESRMSDEYETLEDQKRTPQISVVTQEQFERVAQAVRELQKRLLPVGTPGFPEHAELMEELRRGASLTDAMAALQLSARLEATEKAIEQMISLVTELAKKAPTSRGELDKKSKALQKTAVGTPFETTATTVAQLEKPDGVSGAPGEKSKAADGTQVAPDGTRLAPDGTRLAPDGTRVTQDGTRVASDGTRVAADGTQLASGGTSGPLDGTTEPPSGTSLAPGDRSDTFEESGETSETADDTGGSRPKKYSKGRKKDKKSKTPQESKSDAALDVSGTNIPVPVSQAGGPSDTETTEKGFVVIKPDFISYQELKGSTKQLYDTLVNSVTGMTERISTNADNACKLSQCLEKRIESALTGSNKMLDLENLVNRYADQINALDTGLSSQMTNYQEQLTQMQHDLEIGLETMAEVLGNSGGDTAAVAELNSHFTSLQMDFENMLYRQKDFRETQDSILLDLEALWKEIERLRETKSDREEVADALRDKAGIGELNGLVSLLQFDAVRGDFEKRIGAAYDKFNNQEIVWQRAIDDLIRELGEKADLVQVECLKNEIERYLNIMKSRMQLLIDIVGEPKSAMLSKKLFRNTACLSCGTPAHMDTEEPGLVPALPKMHSSREPAEGAEAKDGGGDHKICYTDFPIPHPKDPRSHVCQRYCGGSHTIVTERPSRVPPGMVVQQAFRPVTTKPGTDGKMYMVDEGPEKIPCLPCNLSKPIPTSAPSADKFEQGTRIVQSTIVPPDSQLTVIVISETETKSGITSGEVPST